MLHGSHQEFGVGHTSNCYLLTNLAIVKFI